MLIGSAKQFTFLEPVSVLAGLGLTPHHEASLVRMSPEGHMCRQTGSRRDILFPLLTSILPYTERMSWEV